MKDKPCSYLKAVHFNDYVTNSFLQSHNSLNIPSLDICCITTLEHK